MPYIVVFLTRAAPVSLFRRHHYTLIPCAMLATTQRILTSHACCRCSMCSLLPPPPLLLLLLMLHAAVTRRFPRDERVESFVACFGVSCDTLAARHVRAFTLRSSPCRARRLQQRRIRRCRGCRIHPSHSFLVRARVSCILKSASNLRPKLLPGRAERGAAFRASRQRRR